MWLQPLGPLKEFPEDEQDRGNANHGVVCEERLKGEVAGLEGAVTIHKDNANLEAERNPGTIWLEVTAVRERLSVEALNFASLVESKVGAAHDDVVNDTTSSDDVGEPGQDFGGVVRQLQERQEREDHDYTEAVDRNTVLGALAQDLGGTALNSKRVQTASRAVSVRVTRREDTRDQEGVDKVGKAADVEILHSNDVGRGSSTALTSCQDADKLWVVVCQNDADAKSTKDEEGTKSEVHSLERGLDVRARTLSLTGDHGDVLGTNDTEGRSPKRT